MICTHHQIFLGDKIKKNETGEACGTYGTRKMHTKFYWETEETLPHGTHLCRWKNIIKIELKVELKESA
jgi:hypothetical protein